MMSELATVGRENQPSESPRLKEGLSAIHQTLGIGVILIGIVAYILTIRADVNANKESVVVLRSEVTVLRTAVDSLAERLRQQELKMSKIEK